MPQQRLSKLLSQALRKQRPTRNAVNHFKGVLRTCLAHIDQAEAQQEHEENFKNYLTRFFKDTFYQDYLVNTKGRIDLAIYQGPSADSSVQVLMEVKRPSNTHEFISPGQLNRKALQELLLYYLRERIDGNNNNIQHLVVTNGYQWYIFKGEDFYRLFYQDSALRKEYDRFCAGQKDSTNNDLFYKEIASPFIEQVQSELNFYTFDLRNYRSLLDPEQRQDQKLVTLYKVFHPVCLLNLPFGNDSNQLNKQFYHELLHIIGLEEVTVKGKKLIQRLPSGQRHHGSLLENAIFVIKERDWIYNLSNRRLYGKNEEEQLFNIALALCLTWVNRILFLKLLEAQLLSYHGGDQRYRFLHEELIQNYDDLASLFFSALAKQKSERSERYRERYQYIPYLNSSLFESSHLESTVTGISGLEQNDMPIYSKTVLKNSRGKRLTATSKFTLHYFFEFLEAYDFSSDSQQAVEESNQQKNLISASVLGLIFEKINGYRDGSFYTPSYITMYMSRQTLRRAVVQRLNDHLGWSLEHFDDLKEDLRDYIRAQRPNQAQARLDLNEAINELRICDPAVGSGHFLVSCLNELIVIKSELHLLSDETGQRLKVFVEVANDELQVEDEDGEYYAYVPAQTKSHTEQKALFHEKQRLIENCLFGVDLNPNSVKICRLRLWIELLKNAYYTEAGELQTLPNIDINIKTGNSLISRFALSDGLASAFRSKKNPYTLTDYKNAVAHYKRTNDKAQKRDIAAILKTIKEAFQDTLSKKFLTRLAEKRGKYEKKKTELHNLKQFGQKITKKQRDALKKLKTAFENALKAKENILNNALYQQAFEWRFEFPEVLDQKGKFRGFDVVIGNPPYFSLSTVKEYSEYFSSSGYETYKKGADIYCLFYEKAHQITKPNGFVMYITSNSWLKTIYGEPLKKYIKDNITPISLLNIEKIQVFEEATVESNILLFKSSQQELPFLVCSLDKTFKEYDSIESFFAANSFIYTLPSSSEWFIGDRQTTSLKEKIENNFPKLSEYNISINFGIKTGFNKAFIIDNLTKNNLINNNKESSNLIMPLLRGRDIQRFHTKEIGYNVIATFPSLSIDIEEHQSIKNFLLTFGKKRLEQSGEKGSRKKTRNKWFETQDSIAYYDDFTKPKIVWGEISDKPKFFYDDTNLYVEATAFLMTGEKLKYLLGILNSKLSEWYFNLISTTTGMGTNRWKKYKIESLPIPSPSEIQQYTVETLVQQILDLKKADPTTDTSALEQELDVLVYHLYHLTYEEARMIDPALSLSEAEYGAAASALA